MKKTGGKRGNLRKFLEGGDLRSIGRADRAVKEVSRDPKLFRELISHLWSEDRLVRMRAGDATEKITRERPEWLLPYKKELMGLFVQTGEPELQWHLAALISRLPLDAGELQMVVKGLKEYLESRSSIVKTLSLQALTDLAKRAPGLREEVIQILHSAARMGTAAMKARSRKLLKSVEDSS